VTAAVLVGPRPAILETVEAAAAGARDAFGVIYETYYQRVFTFIRYRVHHTQLAEDLTHDVFMRALLHLDSVEWQGRDIIAWLITVARNIVFDHRKMTARRRTDPAGIHYDEDGAPVTMWAGGDADPETPVSDQITERDVYRIMLAAVDRLTGPQRQVIVLRYIEELSVAETGAVMALNAGAVKSLTFRGLRTLARLLEGADL